MSISCTQLEKWGKTFCINTTPWQRSTSKSVPKNVYKILMGDSSSDTSEVERAVDERVAEPLLAPEIVYDLRRLTCQPKSGKFDAFWDQLRVYIEELTPTVDDRWHYETPHTPVTISLCHLRQVIKEQLEQKNPGVECEVPSLEWLQLQFWPLNPYSSSALRYTGKLKLKFGVQVRQLRHTRWFTVCKHDSSIPKRVLCCNMFPCHIRFCWW